MDANGFRDAVISATKYMAFFGKEGTFREPIEVENKKGETIKVIPTLCFQEVYEELAE